MRILFINSIQMWGGAEVWLMDVMHGLQARGHQVTLVCRPGTILEKNATSEGFEVFALHMRSDFDPVVIWKIMRVLHRKQIQVICTNMDKELRCGGVAAKLAGNVAVIPSREVDYPLKNKLRYRFTYNFLSDYILANSHSTRKTLLQNAPWLDPNKIAVVYKGIDPRPYLDELEQGAGLRRELNLTPATPLVGFVGQIIERKGIRDIVQCIPIVAQQLPQVKFLFVGEGALQDFLAAKTRELGVTTQTIFTGFRKDIPAVMKAIEVLLLPSSVEGFGYVLIEAMAAARPVVATNVSSIPEIVQHGATGLLVEVHRPQQLAQAILRILQDENLKRSMGQKGRALMLEKFTLARMVSQIEAIFLANARAKSHSANNE
ncbi:MAG: glycosyltransferase family 4 protein [bacterium]